jgi:hypothetical protein
VNSARLGVIVSARIPAITVVTALAPKIARMVASRVRRSASAPVRSPETTAQTPNTASPSAGE